MKLVWTRQHLLVALASLLMIFGFFTFLVVRLISPVQAERVQMERELADEQQRIHMLQQAEGNEQLERIESSVRLQQQLPVQPLMDQLLLALSRAEGISGTYITSIHVEEDNEASFLTNDRELEQREEPEEDPLSSTLTEPTVEEDEPSVPVTAVEELPTTVEGLKMIRFLVTVRTTSYEGLARFAEEIDKLERIMNIDMISYVSPEERVQVDDELNSLEFTIVVSAFYYPELAELEEESPTADYPNPASKRTPFYNE